MTLRHFGIALLAAAALLPLAGSCAKIEKAEADSLVALGYNVAREKPRTKASDYPTTVPFKSYAWYLPADKTWAADKADAVPYFADVTVEYQTDKWRGADKSYYWPRLGSLSFWSYSPASIPGASSTSGVSVTKDGVTLTDWTVDASTHQDIDFMVADFKSDLKANTLTYGWQGVPTLFRHKLAKVTVQASVGAADPNDKTKPLEKVIIYKVSFKQVYTKGSYTPEQAATATSEAKPESWGSRSELREIVIFDKPDGYMFTDLKAQNITLDGKGLLVIPQVLNADTARGSNGVSLYIEYSINDTRGTADRLLPEIKSQLWDIGKHYTYSIVIGEENEPIEFDAKVGDWTAGGSQNVTIGTI